MQNKLDPAVTNPLCLSQTVTGQQKQHFRAQPEDLEVKQGTTAVLQCAVGNQGGRVQWAKDGFVLGEYWILFRGVIFGSL